MSTEHAVLVAYASRTGTTAAIAESVAVSLRHSGIATHCCSVRDVHRMGPWSAVVLGSATHHGRWDMEMIDFLRFHPGDLSDALIYLFETGEGTEGARGIERSVRALQVRSLRSFSSGAPVQGRRLWRRAIHAPFDPEPPAEWAREIAGDLLMRELHEDLAAWDRLCDGPGRSA